MMKQTVPVSIKGVVLALLMVPGLACADFWTEQPGQTSGVSSLLIQPPLAFLSRQPAPVMFPGPYDATTLGVSMSYLDPHTPPVPYLYGDNPPATHSVARHYFATAMGEYAISKRIGVFGKFGLRYSGGGTGAAPELSGYLPHLDHRYGVGLNVRASEILSVHFEWERHAEGSASSSGASPSNPAWDPWKERNVMGVGVRMGF